MKLKALCVLSVLTISTSFVGAMDADGPDNENVTVLPAPPVAPEVGPFASVRPSYLNLNMDFLLHEAMGVTPHPASPFSAYPLLSDDALMNIDITIVEAAREEIDESISSLTFFGISSS